MDCYEVSGLDLLIQPREEILEGTLDECDDAIGEIYAMIDYALSVGNKDEVRSWRRMLQQQKIYKRKLRKQIA